MFRSIVNFEDTWRKEDRILRFVVRLSLVLTLLSVEIVAVLAMLRILLLWTP